MSTMDARQYSRSSSLSIYADNSNTCDVLDPIRRVHRAAETMSFACKQSQQIITVNARFLYASALSSRLSIFSIRMLTICESRYGERFFSTVSACNCSQNANTWSCIGRPPSSRMLNMIRRVGKNCNSPAEIVPSAFVVRRFLDQFHRWSRIGRKIHRLLFGWHLRDFEL